MCWFYDKQEWKEKQQHKFESHRTPFMKTTLELGQYWKGQLKTCNAIGGCIPPNFTFMYWLNAFSPAVQPLCGCQPCRWFWCRVLWCSIVLLSSSGTTLWMPARWFWCRVLSCSIVLLSSSATTSVDARCMVLVQSALMLCWSPNTGNATACYIVLVALLLSVVKSHGNFCSPQVITLGR